MAKRPIYKKQQQQQQQSLRRAFVFEEFRLSIENVRLCRVPGFINEAKKQSF